MSKCSDKVAAARAPAPLSAALAETRKSLADDSWIDEITALDEDGEPDDFARRVVPLEYALEAIDRIEAAAKRERDEARKARDEARETAEDALWELAELRERAPGNAAAMREALSAFVDSVQWLCDGDERGTFKKQFAPLLSEARAALAAPARNCDVGTAEEQAERHGRFCAAHYKADAVDAQCFGCPASDKKETDCEFVWGQLPFAPAKEPAK